jgi:hypothetical protein
MWYIANHHGSCNIWEMYYTMKKWFLGRCSQCHTTKLKLDEEKLKCAGLAEENGFDSALLHTIWWLVRDIAMLWGGGAMVVDLQERV